MTSPKRTGPTMLQTAASALTTRLELNGRADEHSHVLVDSYVDALFMDGASPESSMRAFKVLLSRVNWHRDDELHNRARRLGTLVQWSVNRGAVRRAEQVA
jgi:hypothetical protein